MKPFRLITFFMGVWLMSWGLSVALAATPDTITERQGGQVTNPAPKDDQVFVPITQGLSWSAVAGATSYKVAFGTTNPPPEMSTVSDPNCNPSNGSGGLAAGLHQTTVAGRPATVIVGDNYDPQKPSYLSFYLHGDGGQDYEFTASNVLAQYIKETNWVFVSPLALDKATSPNNPSCFAETCWYNRPEEHTQLLSNIFEEMYAKYNLCRDTMFGTSASGGSVFYTRTFFPVKGATYPAYMVPNCGGAGLSADFFTNEPIMAEEAMVYQLGKNSDITYRSQFQFSVGTEDFLITNTRYTANVYEAAGLRIMRDEIANAGHCGYGISTKAVDYFKAVAPTTTRYSYNPGTLTEGTTYYWQITADNGVTSPVFKFTTVPAQKGTVINGDFSQGNYGWRYQRGNPKNPDMASNCGAGQARVGGQDFVNATSQCITNLTHGSAWTLAAKMRVEKGQTNTKVGIDASFFTSASCTGTAVKTESLNTTELTMTPLNKTFTYDTQVNNIQSISITLRSDLTTMNPVYGCFDDVSLTAAGAGNTRVYLPLIIRAE